MEAARKSLTMSDLRAESTTLHQLLYDDSEKALIREARKSEPPNLSQRPGA